MRRLAGIVILVLLSACAEDTQELRVSSEQVAAQDQTQEAARRARTAGQNESARIYR